MLQFSPTRRSLALAFGRNALKPLQQILGPCVVAAGAGITGTPSTILTWEVIYWLMCCVALSENGVMRTAVEQFWDQITPSLPEQDLEPVTDAAFCTARKRSGVAVFKSVFDRFVKLFRSRFGGHFLWKGLRLNGIDGTTLDLPANAKDLLERFPAGSGKHGSGSHPQMLLVALVDLWTGLAPHFLAVPKKRGENFCARWLARYLGKGDLLLGDRNFPAYDLFCWIRRTGAHFLIRTSKWRFSATSYARTYLGGRCDDYLMILTVPTKVAKQHPNLPRTLTVRVLEHQLPNGHLLRIMTSLLDHELYSYEELVALYAERWHHETSHREWKHSLELANIRSNTTAGILQEIFVQLTLNNVLRWIQADACKGQPFKPVDLQFLGTKRLALMAARRAEYTEDHDLPQLYADLVAAVAKKRILKRPGRNYPRKPKEIVKARKAIDQPSPGRAGPAAAVMKTAVI